MSGFTTRAAETLLSDRAADLLSAGPADAVKLVEHICQMPGAPPVVAEQMALALFADRPQFTRDGDGRWWLSAQLSSLPSSGSAPLSGSPSGPFVEVRGGTSLDTPITPARSLTETTVFARPDGVRPDDLSRLSYAVVDLETTGSSPWAGHRVTEVAAVVIRDGEVVDSFESLVNPERSIPPMITALTNISWQMVRDAPRFRDICERLLAVLDGHIFVAHNADFDWRFVSAEVQRATGRRIDGRRLCTVRLARRVLPQLRSRRLDSVALHYGVDITARHRAGGDAQATARVLLGLLRDVRETHACVCWADLEALLTRGRAKGRRGRRAMPGPGEGWEGA